MTMTTTQAARVDLAELEDVTAVYAGVAQVRVFSESGPPGRATVVAEQSATPGLVILPRSLRAEGFTGYWIVTHAASGLGIPAQFAAGETIYAARRVAVALGETGVDWTLPYEALRPQLVEHVDQIREAVLRGRYPDPPADHMPPGEGPAPYPRSDAQATADAVARYLVAQGCAHSDRSLKLLRRDDRDGREIASLNIAACVTEFGLASALRKFARVDQAAADAAARMVWNGWEDGQNVAELLCEWAEEYGIPEPPDVVDEQPAAAAAVEVKERNQT